MKPALVPILVALSIGWSTDLSRDATAQGRPSRESGGRPGGTAGPGVPGGPVGPGMNLPDLEIVARFDHDENG
jgi:hypothetical protein